MVDESPLQSDCVYANLLSVTTNPTRRTRGCPDPLFLSTRYSAGWTQGELADHFGVHVATVCRWMSRLGIETREASRKRSRRP